MNCYICNRVEARMAIIAKENQLLREQNALLRARLFNLEKEPDRQAAGFERFVVNVEVTRD